MIELYNIIKKCIERKPEGLEFRPRQLFLIFDAKVPNESNDKLTELKPFTLWKLMCLGCKHNLQIEKNVCTHINVQESYLGCLNISQYSRLESQQAVWKCKRVMKRSSINGAYRWQTGS